MYTLEVMNMNSRVAAPDGKRQKDGTPLMVLPEDSTLNREYRVEYLGAGGMSITYKALKEGIPYFIKEVPSSDSKKVIALSQEKATLERLDHPGTVKVFDLFEENGYYYLVMEYIEGTSLDRLIPLQGSAPLKEKDVFLWAWQLYEIFEYLHSQKPQIIYRDLKPQNVIKDPEGRIHLIDFGIARVYKEYKDWDTESMGTVLTASPEHYGGKQTDVRSDIYTIGATLHCLFTGGGDRGSGVFEFAPVSSLRPGFSKELDKVILKAVEIMPDDRFQSIEEMRMAHLQASQLQIDEIFKEAYSTKELAPPNSVMKAVLSDITDALKESGALSRETAGALKVAPEPFNVTAPQQEKENGSEEAKQLEDTPKMSQKASSLKAYGGIFIFAILLLCLGIFLIHSLIPVKKDSASSKSSQTAVLNTANGTETEKESPATVEVKNITTPDFSERASETPITESSPGRAPTATEKPAEPIQKQSGKGKSKENSARPHKTGPIKQAASGETKPEVTPSTALPSLPGPSYPLAQSHIPPRLQKKTNNASQGKWFSPPGREFSVFIPEDFIPTRQEKNKFVFEKKNSLSHGLPSSYIQLSIFPNVEKPMEFAQFKASSLEKNPKVTMIDKEKKTVNGKNAYEINYIIRGLKQGAPGYSVKELYFMDREKRKAYSFLITAPGEQLSRYKSEVGTLISTFQY